jgi:hypothetical protein
VQVKRWFARILVGLAIAMTALASVGLTAPADGVFSIAIHPTLVRVDGGSLEQPRARVLGLDIDIKVGSMHTHFGWALI